MSPSPAAPVQHSSTHIFTLLSGHITFYKGHLSQTPLQLYVAMKLHLLQRDMNGYHQPLSSTKLFQKEIIWSRFSLFILPVKRLFQVYSALVMKSNGSKLNRAYVLPAWMDLMDLNVLMEQYCSDDCYGRNKLLHFFCCYVR